MEATPRRPVEDLARLAAEGRYLVLKTVAAAKAGHVGGPLSAMDILVALYHDVLSVDPARPTDPERDRFVLSKGHNAVGLYVVLAQRGFLDLEELTTFDQGNSRLQGHPDMLRLPGLDASTGSLGQGLGLGCGMAEGLRRAGRDATTFVLLGDGEHQEGMVWESVVWAARNHLDGLVAIVDRNGLQQYGWGRDEDPESRFDRRDPWAGVDLGSVYRGFGWDVIEVDGNDIGVIRDTLRSAKARVGTAGRPLVVLATTEKGHGVSFTRGTYMWHNGVPTDEQLAIARDDLGLAEGGDDGRAA